jgi:hypothetical protein
MPSILARFFPPFNNGIYGLLLVDCGRPFVPAQALSPFVSSYFAEGTGRVYLIPQPRHPQRATWCTHHQPGS